MGLSSVLVPIDGVATLVATHVDPVLQSAGWADAVKQHCRVAGRGQYDPVQLPFLLVR